MSDSMILRQNFGRQQQFIAVRPSVSSFDNGLGLVKSKQWATIRQNTPDTVYLNESPFSASAGAAYSGVINNSYEGSSGSEKTIIELNSKLTQERGWNFIWNQGNYYPDGFNIRAIYEYVYQLSISGFGATGIIRIRPITEEYDVSLLTWNIFNSSPPVMGAEYLINIRCNTEINTSTDGGDDPTPTKTYAGIVSSFLDKPGDIFLTDGAITGFDIFGFVIDCKINFANESDTSSLQLRCDLSVNPPNVDNFAPPFVYAIPFDI